MRFRFDFGPLWLPKCLPFGTPLATKIGQKIDRKLDCSKCHRKIAPRSPKTPPRASQEPPRRPQDAQKCSQEAPKTAPRHQKMIPRGPTYSQERLKTAPQAHGNGIAGRASSSASPRGDHPSWGSGRCFRRRRTRYANYCLLLVIMVINY